MAILNTASLIFKLQNYPLQQAEAALTQTASFSIDEKNDWRDIRKWEIAKLHYQNNPTYKKIVGPVFPDQWNDLPIVTKQHLLGNLTDLITSPYKPNEIYIGNTSGSSGHPFYFAKDKFTHALTWAYIRKMYHLYDIKETDFLAQLKEQEVEVKA